MPTPRSASFTVTATFTVDEHTDEHLRNEQAIRDEARQLFKDGVVAYDKKRYVAALAAFERAYELKPHPIVLLNLAQSELMAGRLDDACFHFKIWKEGAVDPSASVAKQVAQGIKAACH